MQIPSVNLINIAVETQSGEYLGRVSSFDIDTDSQAIRRYYVKTGLIQGLWHQHLIIDSSQVLSIGEEKMVVEDNVSKQPAEIKNPGLVSPAAR